MKEMKKVDFFKVKKIKRGNDEFLGVVIPKIDVYRDYKMDKERVYLVTLAGEKLNVSLKYEDLKPTRICNKKIKKQVDLLIKNLKVIYEEEKKLSKKYSEFIKEKEKFDKKVEKLDNNAIIEKINKIKGVFSIDVFKSKCDEFEEQIKHKKNTYIEMFLDMKNDYISGFTICQIWESGKYPRISDYPFLEEEYDRALFVNSYFLATSKEGIKIKNNFKLINDKFKIKDCKIKTDYHGEVGDKDIIYIMYDVDFKFKKARKLNQETLDYIKSIIEYFNNKAK